MIVVFGSVNLDIVFSLPRLPAPGMTVLGESYRLVPGGKGANQALAAARDGALVHMIGAVGEDGFAPLALAALRTADVDVTAVRAVSEPTGCAAVCVAASGENQIAVASGANLLVSAKQLVDAALTPETVVVLQMEVSQNETADVIVRSRKRGSRVIWNFAPALLQAPRRDLLAAVDLLVANEGEAAALASGLGVAAAAPTDLAATLADALGNHVAVTLGAAGSVLAGLDKCWRIAALPLTPIDTTGAGDAFVGVLAAGVDRGMALPAAAHRASVAAGLACLLPGAQSSLPTTSEIDRHMAQLGAPALQR
jgi:ribokinase